MKHFVSVLSVLLFISLYHCPRIFGKNPHGLSLGIGGGYTNAYKIKEEIYLKIPATLFDKRSEIKTGLNFRPYKVRHFDDIYNLKANSLGIFADLAVYPFEKYIFVGVRWEVLTFNWLNSESKKRIEDTNMYRVVNMYTGTSAYLQAGTELPINDKMGFKIYALPGLQNYKIKSAGRYSYVISYEKKSENQTRFVCDVNVSFEVKF